MFKRLRLMAAVFFLLAAFITPAFAGTDKTDISSVAIKDAEQTYSDYYKDWSLNLPENAPEKDFGLHYITSTGLSNITDGNGNSYGFLTYGQPHGDPVRNGQYRYIGYTFYGEDYTNMDYPADKNANGADFASQGWIKQPWNDPTVKSNNKNMYIFSGDGSPEYHTAILAGIMAYGATNANNGYKIIQNNQAFWNNIEQYVHILAPPTNYAWGIGRMWHYSGGSLWYVTVPIMPKALLPDLDLAVTSLDPGMPVGEKAEPGREYTGTVVFENQSAKTKTVKPAAVKVTHNGYAAVVYDDFGKTVKELELAPGEKKTLHFKWHGPTDEKASVLKAAINLPPDVSLPEENLQNNERSVTISVDIDNLWVEILDYTREAFRGGTATVHARIHNDRGVLLTTRLVWKVNGSIVKDVNNYDLIGSLDDSITFTMPDRGAVVTVEVNPDHDKPANEIRYDDNMAGCTVKAQYIRPSKKDTDVLKVRIEAPSRVGWKNTIWPYKVVVTTDYPEPPPPPPGSDDDPPPPPTITMNLDTTGQTVDNNIGYRDDGYQRIIPVELTSHKVFSSGWGRQEHTFTYSYNKPGLYVFPVTVTIKATANSSWGQSAAATANVILDPIPPLERELQITH